jgi:hypothetical protein
MVWEMWLLIKERLKLQYSTRKRPHANGGFCQPEIENLP